MNSSVKRLTASDFPEIWAIMTEAFPENEYRTSKRQQELFSFPEYKVFGVFDSGLIGFFALWDFGTFTFGEHLAVSENVRGSGTGSRLLSYALENTSSPFILEIELPVDALSRRREGFYKRNGFIPCDFPYFQQSLKVGCEPYPMKIMSTASLTAEEFKPYRKTIYNIVYNYKSE